MSRHSVGFLAILGVAVSVAVWVAWDAAREVAESNRRFDCESILRDRHILSRDTELRADCHSWLTEFTKRRVSR